ncbi:MAG: DGQHR domain-containing protein [Candidatus Binatia bacterium]
MRITGRGFEQGDVKLFLGVVKAKQLAEKVDSDVWAPDIFKMANPEGYQRALSEARAREFGRFVLRNGICPLSILVNFREGTVSQSGNGTLELPEGRAYIVDGQHRAEGIKYAVSVDSAAGDFEVPVVVMNEPDRYEEARQFVIINRSQKGVRADLAERFLLQAVKREGRAALVDAMESGVLRRVLKGAEWITKAVEMADTLNADKDSPWYRRIRLPNERKDGTVVSQKAFTDSLEPILKDSYYQGKEAKVIAAALRNYWSAIRALCQAAFDEPAEHVIQKTSGVGVLHKVFPRVSELCTDQKGNRVLTVEMIKSVLDGLPQMQSIYWESNGEAGKRGTGKKAVAILAIELLEALETRAEAKEHGLIV